MRRMCLFLFVIPCYPGGLNAQAEVDQTGPIATGPIQTKSIQLDEGISRLGGLTRSQLEYRLAEIDEQLQRLCPISLRSGVGAVGSRTAVGPEAWRSEWFQIELDGASPIDQIVLVPTIWRDTRAGLRADGFPLEFRIVVGSKGDSTGTVVARYTEKDGLLPRIAPLVVPCPSIVASWVRVEALRLSPRLWDDQYVLQLSEVLVFSGQENVALNQNVVASSGMRFEGETRHKRFLVDGFVPYLMDAKEGEKSIAFRKQGEMDDNPNRPLSAITDGRNFHGAILPTRDWINDLAARHKLETDRPLVIAELNRHYSRQASHLTRMTWLAALAIVGIGLTIFIDFIIRSRQLAKIKERFAADLHDELGANLHVIGLLGDLAQDAVDSPEKLKRLLQRIRVMTERSGTAVQFCTNTLDAKGLYTELLADMQRTTQRIMADQEGELRFRGNEESLRRLKPRTRADLFLFYKECLVNISRHSEATQFSAHLEAKPNDLTLIVCDNGHGLVDSPGDGVPPSLMRRARLIGAQVTVTHPERGGACVKLQLRIRKAWRQK
ncbi:sensor histidine kinase [Novipirellula artificiosorum]|nr:histidine kinase [Novipirellula artificiosorum]